MGSSTTSLYARRGGRMLRVLALMLIASLLSSMAPAPPAALPPGAGIGAPAPVAPSATILPALDPRYDLEGVQLAKLLPAEIGEDALFGYAMALDGDTLAISARDGQFVFLYTRESAGQPWQQVARLGTGLLPGGRTYYGVSVAIDGDTLVVGSLESRSEYSTREGAIHIYERNQGGPNNWGQVAKRALSGIDVYVDFGNSVAIDGDTIVVGAPGDSGSGGVNVGAAYVYERDTGGAGQWGQSAKLVAAAPTNWRAFGRAVAIDGDTIAVSEPRSSGYDSSPGAVYLFQRDTLDRTSWHRLARPTASDSSDNNDFGYALALQGDTLVVGVPVVGAAYIYQRNAGGAGQWAEVQRLTGSDAPNSNAFGYSVALQGDRMVIGAVDAMLGMYQGGAVYIYDRDVGGSGSWVERSRLLPRNEAVYWYFGSSVAVSGDSIVVGSYGDQDHGYNSGSAFAFQVYQRPTLADDRAETDEDTPVSIDVLSNDQVVGAGALDPASVRVTTAPARGMATVNTSNGAISYAPQRDFNGLDSFAYSASSTFGASRTALVTVTARPVNDAPFFTTMPLTSTAAYSPYKGSIVTGDVDAGDGRTISAQDLPGWLALGPTVNGTAVLSGTATGSDIGSQVMRLQVTDAGGLSTTRSFTITVRPNSPPRFTRTAPTQAREGVRYTYNIGVADPNVGQALTISAPLKPDWLALLPGLQGTTILTGTPDYTAVGEHMVRLQVTDPGGLSATQTFTVSVAPAVPLAPAKLIAVPASASTIRLAWVDASSDEIGFEIERRSGGGAWEQVATVGAGAASYIDMGLECGTIYEYRVSAFNQHWSSAPSNIASTTPSELATHTFVADGAVALPAAGYASAPIQIAEVGAIADLDVRVTIDHIYAGDLVLSLVAPDGTIVPLSSHNGGFGRNYQGTIFDEEAASPITGGDAPFNGRYRPQASLGPLYGRPLAGTWALLVQNSGGFQGIVQAFGLDIVATAGCPGMTPTPTATLPPAPTPSPTATPTPTPRAPTTIYVRAGAGGASNGTSWADAYTRLQDALAVAAAGDSIWVAAGTYTPADDGNRNAVFQMVNGATLYGGFAGVENALDQRDWQTNATVLSGDIGAVGDSSDNSQVILRSSGATATTIVDGFSVVGGATGIRNDHSSPTLRNLVVRDGALGIENSYSSPSVTDAVLSGNSGYQGGGMYNAYSSPALRHVTFISNTAIYGGGIYNWNSSPSLNDAAFVGNVAIQDGGGIYNDASGPLLDTVTFNDNLAVQGHGGGMYSSLGQAALKHVVFNRNRTSATYGRGGGMHSWFSTVTLEDVTFSGNAAVSSGGGMFQQFKSATLRRVAFESNTAADGGGLALIGSSAGLDDVSFTGNVAQSTVGHGGGIHITDGSSATMKHVRFVANRAGMRGGAAAISFDCGALLLNAIISGNSAGEDGGAIFNLGVLNITNSSMWYNTTQQRGGGLFNDGAAYIRNSIWWGNTAGGEGAHAYNNPGPLLNLQYSLVQGGYPGTGNISGDPLFVNPAGADGFLGTLDDDLHLGAGSPAIDAGNNAEVPAGTLRDLDAQSRFANDPGVADTGSGTAPIVDIGPYERLAGAPPTPTPTLSPTSTSTPTSTPIPALPGVTKISSSADTGDGQLSEDEIARVAIQTLSVQFNADISSFRRDAFLLLAEGAQPGFQTSSCAQLTPGDQRLLSNFESFQYPSRTIVLGFYYAGWSPLPDGRYRLIVCDTVTGSYPLLDGDGDGLAGGDFVRNFVVDRTLPTPTSTATPTPTSTPTSTPTNTPTPTATTLSATSTPTRTQAGPAQLSIDDALGKPGSSFLIAGAAFPPKASASVLVNGAPIGTVTTDQAGGFKLLLDTAGGAVPGKYEVVVAILGIAGSSGQPAQVSYWLQQDAPLRTREHSEDMFVLAVPASILPQDAVRLYLPLVGL